MSKGKPKSGGRRRGLQLETELLDAAWHEVVEVGYANLTMESVAIRAGTGAAVLYRRWSNKEELLIAALVHYQAKYPLELPETGTLRGDLSLALTAINDTRVHFWAVVISTAYSGLLKNTGLTFTELRKRLLNEQQHSRVQDIYRRAELRGEIKLSRIPPAVLTMPFDLVRHDMLMDPKPLKRGRIKSIIDDLCLPLIELNNQQTGSRARKPRI